MIDFVVDLAVEHVDLDGSQFSESILERWYSARASSRTFSSTRKQRFLSTTEFQLAVARLERLARWK